MGVSTPDYDTHCPTCDAPEPTHTSTCAVEVSTIGHVTAECAVCGLQVPSRPGWGLEHRAEGHLAFFWGHPSATPGYASTRAPLPEVEDGAGVAG